MPSAWAARSASGAELAAQRSGEIGERLRPADHHGAGRRPRVVQRAARPGPRRASGPSAAGHRPAAGPAGHQASTPSARHLLRQRRACPDVSGASGLASRSPNPACPASSRPPSGSISQSRHRGRARPAASASSSRAAATAFAVGRPRSAAAQAEAEPARGRVPAPRPVPSGVGWPGDLRGQFRDAFRRIPRPAGSSWRRASRGRAAQLLHQHAAGQVDHRAGWRLPSAAASSSRRCRATSALSRAISAPLGSATPSCLPASTRNRAYSHATARFAIY